MRAAISSADRTEAIALAVAGLYLTMQVPAELAGELARLWGHLRVDAPSVSAPGDAGGDELEFVLVQDPARPNGILVPRHRSASYAVSGRVTREVIRSLLGQRLLLHAGAVEHPALGTVVMVGASGAGKSTATTQLGRDGRYLTDELTIIDPGSFTVTPYPKPISLRLAGELAKRDFAPSELGLVPGEGGESPQMIVFLERDGMLAPGEGSVRRVPLAESLCRLAGQSSSLWRVPGGLTALATLLTSIGGGVAVTYGDAVEIEGLLRGAPPCVYEPFEVLARGDGTRPALATAGAARRTAEPDQYLVTPFAQALSLESGMLLVAEREAAHLPGLAGLVWEQLFERGGLDEEHLMLLLVEEHGEHPHGTKWVRDVLADLLSRGWIRRG